MPTPLQLEVTAHTLIAVLGLWLGMTVATRSRALPSRIFTLLSFSLVVWSCAIIVERLSTLDAAVVIGHAVEESAGALIVPATAHLCLAIATEGHPGAGRRRIVWILYALSFLFALPGILDPGHPVNLKSPNFSLGPIPAEVFGWGWNASRLGSLALGMTWLLQACRRASSQDPRRRQLAVTLATVIVAGAGGAIRFLPVVGESDPWIGISLIAVGMVLAAAAVLPAGVFFAPEIAGRAFWRAIGMGIGLFVLVAALVAVDTASRDLLGLELPLLTALALVVTIAVYEPAAAWLRTRLRDRSPTDIARERLVRALGQSTLTAQAADAGIQPALARLVRALDLRGAAVLHPDGATQVAYGAIEPGLSPGLVRRALLADGKRIGDLEVLPAAGRPLGPRDEALIELSVGYLAAALGTSVREDAQLVALNDLSQEQANLQASAAAFHEALVERASTLPGLRVFALGSLRVERGGERITRWGGMKAGTRQAQGLFAFLFDRGERGVAKDEALELIWPDIDLERADLAFHRTLNGLRRTLDPGGRTGRQVIRFYNDRYRLDPALIEWSDVAAFLAHLEEARATGDRAAAHRILETARALYRGEYLDDCPFYGDSTHVEDRRAAFRSRCVDLLLTLGQWYEQVGDRVAAAGAYRDALAMTDECPPASAGLTRLGFTG